MLLENNNHQIIKKLAKKSVQCDKMRNGIAILTIALAVSLIMAGMLAAFGLQKQQEREAEQLYQATFTGLTKSEIAQLQTEPSVKNTVALCLASSVQNEEYSTDVVYVSEAFFSSKENRFSGSFPAAEREIVVTKGLLEKLAMDLNVGDRISLDLGDGVQEYTISGIFTPSSERQDSFTIYCSEPMLVRLHADGQIAYTSYLYLSKEYTTSESTVTAQISALSEKYQIAEADVSLNGGYLRLLNHRLSASAILQYGSLALIVLLAAGLVIYSIFYIAVNQKTRQYGQFRTIGMTKKQVSKMILLEGLRAAIPGVFLGILLGGIIGYATGPSGWDFTNALAAAGISALFGFLMVMLSVYAPAKAAGHVSPTEALNYSAYSSSSAHQRKGHHKATPFRLALLNLQRNSRKTVLTMLSLGFCGILLIVGASMQLAHSPEMVARKSAYQYGDFKVEFDPSEKLLATMGADAANYGIAPFQSNGNKLTAALRKQILVIDGVRDIRTWCATSVRFSLEDLGVEDQTRIHGYEKSDTEKLSQFLLDGSADYDALTQNNGIILNNAENLMQELYKWNPKVGDQITISFWQADGKPVAQTFEIMGITDGQDGFQGFLRMPAELLERMTGYPCDISLEVITDTAKNTSVEAELLSLIGGQQNLSLHTFAIYVMELDSSFTTGFAVLYGFIFFLGAFGVVNLINSTITNQLSRKQETGMMRAVGMSAKQLRTSFVAEGEMIVLGAMVFALFLGIPIGWFATRSANVTADIGSYQFPLAVFLLFAVLLAVIEFALSVFLNHNLKKQSLVEQMRGVA